MPTQRAERVARNEARFRDINQELRDDLRQLPEEPANVRFVCECGIRTCEETVQVSFAEFEAVRSNPRRFFVLPGHELPDVETVIERLERYTVVEKPDDVADIVDP